MKRWSACTTREKSMPADSSLMSAASAACARMMAKVGGAITSAYPAARAASTSWWRGVFCVNCSGKLADLFATDGVGALGGIDPAHNLRVNAHDFSLPFLCTVFSSNAQSGQTAVQVTGVQACSISSHFYLLAKAPTRPAQAGVGWTGTRNQSKRKKLCLPT